MLADSKAFSGFAVDDMEAPSASTAKRSDSASPTGRWASPC